MLQPDSAAAISEGATAFGFTSGLILEGGGVATGATCGASATFTATGFFSSTTGSGFGIVAGGVGGIATTAGVGLDGAGGGRSESLPASALEPSTSMSPRQERHFKVAVRPRTRRSQMSSGMAKTALQALQRTE